MPNQAISSPRIAANTASHTAAMQNNIRHRLQTGKALALSALLIFSTLSAQAQGNGRLYDPEPPVDSSYVRLIIAQPGSAAAIQVDGQSRIRKLSPFQASDYLVLKEGAHTLTLLPEGKSNVSIKHQIDISRGKSFTLAFPELKSDATPIRFEDRGNTNQLKAQLTAYNLDKESGPLTVSLADNSAKVFSDLAYGHSASLQVNPINVELIVGNSKVTPHKFSLKMTQGATYSLFFSRNENGKLQAHTVLSKTERYTGQ